jgi:hypothetical protein
VSVGLGLAALLAFDAFYSDSHGSKMCIPSRFAFNAVAFMGVLVYMVVRKTRELRATIGETGACVLGACLLHSGFAGTFPRVFSERPGSGLWIFIILELLIVVRVTVAVIRYIHKVHRAA